MTFAVELRSTARPPRPIAVEGEHSLRAILGEGMQVEHRTADYTVYTGTRPGRGPALRNVEAEHFLRATKADRDPFALVMGDAVIVADERFLRSRMVLA